MAAGFRRILRLSTNFRCSDFTPGLKPSIHLRARPFHSNNACSARVGFNLSDIGEGIREVVVKEWYVKEGDRVQQFDNICEVQSDKASVTITSRYDGTVAKLHYAVDETALVGRPLVDIDTDGGDDIEDNSTSSSDEEITHNTRETVQAEKKDTPTNEKDITKQGNEIPILCLPSVRRLAKEHKIDLSLIQGTGKGGRVLKEDVLRFLEKKPDRDSNPVVNASLEDRIEPIKGFQKAMVKTMTESLKVPLFVYGDEIKTTKLSELRRSLNALPELAEVRISVSSFFIKAISNALQRYPVLNSSLDENCENVVYHRAHNIGVAMDTKAGLAVPVIKRVETLSVLDVAREMKRLIQSGRDGNFSPSDLSGGTFAISNIGAIAGTYMKPIPLPSQVAIIAIGASQVLPRFDEKGNVVAEEILNVSTSADHRIVDGATVARFTQCLKRQIENPYLIFLNV